MFSLCSPWEIGLEISQHVLECRNVDHPHLTTLRQWINDFRKPLCLVFCSFNKTEQIRSFCFPLTIWTVCRTDSTLTNDKWIYERKNVTSCKKKSKKILTTIIASRQSRNVGIYRRLSFNGQPVISFIDLYVYAACPLMIANVLSFVSGRWLVMQRHVRSNYVLTVIEINCIYRSLTKTWNPPLNIIFFKN